MDKAKDGNSGETKKNIKVQFISVSVSLIDYARKQASRELAKRKK